MAAPIVPAPVPSDQVGVPALLGEALPDGSVRCHACAHRCLLRPDRVGICGVRENRDGTLRSLVYGRAVAAHVDPIEKKPLFHVAPNTLAYSIATVGCDFHCDFCQNWEIAQAPRLGLDLEARHLPPSSAVAEAIHAGASSIAYTYVEPTVFIEYVLDTGRLARPAGLPGLVRQQRLRDPGGGRAPGRGHRCRECRPEVLRRPLLPAPLRRPPGARAGLAGRDAPSRHLARGDDPRHPGPHRRPGRAAGAHGLDRRGARCGDPVATVSRFFPAHRMLDVPSTPLRTLAEAAEIGRAAGLLHVYVGNAPELGLESTACAGCGQPLLERHGYRTVRLLTPEGTCPSCGRALAGLRLATIASGPVMSAFPCG